MILMSSQRWICSRTAVYNLNYHIIWCSKYRRRVLKNQIRQRLIILLQEKAKEINVKIESMEIMEDYVHLFVTADPTSCPHWIIQQFKGYTSRKLRKEFKELTTRLPTLWTRSYYIESVGHISDDTIKKYIEDQKGR